MTPSYTPADLEAVRKERRTRCIAIWLFVAAFTPQAAIAKEAK